MNNLFYKKVYKNEPFKAKQGIVYVDPDLAIEVVDRLAALDSLQNKYNQTLKNNDQFVIIIVNALSGTLALAARERFPKARIICVEYFPFEIKHLLKMGFEVVDLEMNVENFTLEYMNKKLTVAQRVQRGDLGAILGNPPYQADNPKSQSLWPLFIQKSTTICPYVCLVVPTRWCAHSYNVKKGKIKLFTTFMREHLVEANIAECSRHFNAGFTKRYFSYFILNMEQKQTQTSITSPEDVFSCSILQMEQLPYNVTSRLSFSIATKIDTYVKQFGSFDKFREKSKYQSDGLRRLVFGVGRFVEYNKMPLRLDKGDLTYNTKLSHVNYILPVDHNVTLKSASSVFRSSLFKFYLHIFDPKDTYSPAMFKSLPRIDLTRVWTDDEIFDHFKQHAQFTNEEVDYIRAIIE